MDAGTPHLAERLSHPLDDIVHHAPG